LRCQAKRSPCNKAHLEDLPEPTLGAPRPQEILALREFQQREVTQSGNFGAFSLTQARISLKLHGSLFGGFGNQSDTY
jgi:hypothetical protein